MPITLCANTSALVDSFQLPPEQTFTVILDDGSGESGVALAERFQSAQRLDDLLQIDIASDRLSRLNFDAVGSIILDLPVEYLLSSQGRRLSDALGRLAQDALTVIFAGPACAVAGAFLLDGETAALNLIPRTVVVPDVNAVPDLRSLLGQISEAKLRLLALDGQVAAHYDSHTSEISVLGEGSVLLGTLRAENAESVPTMRLQLLQTGARGSWPR